MPAAFPEDVYYDEKRIDQRRGMELRDYFAAQVAAGYQACLPYGADSESWPEPEQFARYVYEVADAMIAERKKSAARRLHK